MKSTGGQKRQLGLDVQLDEEAVEGVVVVAVHFGGSLGLQFGFLNLAHLLQQDPEEAVATRAFVDGSTAGRVWAHGVARELEPLAGDRLPELPAEGAVAQADAAAATDAEDDDEDAPTAFAPAATAGPRVSRRGGAMLIGGAVVAIAIAVVLVLVLTGGKDDKSANTAAQAANTTSTQAQPKVRAQVNLTPPKGAPVKKAVAIVQFVDVNGQQAINAATQGLPNSKTVVYGLWFYNSKSQAKLIGGFDQTDNKGHLVLQGQLPKGVDIASYKDLVITREKPSTNPTSPGTIYLRGTIQNAAGG